MSVCFPLSRVRQPIMSTDDTPLGEQADKQSRIQIEAIAEQHRHAQESGKVFDGGPAGQL